MLSDSGGGIIHSWFEANPYIDSVVTKALTFQVVGLIGREERKNSQVLSISLPAEWGRSSSEDCHLHNCFHLIGGFADYLHPAGSDPHTAVQLAQHPQEPGGRPFLLRACVPHWDQPNRKPGKSYFLLTVRVVRI